MKQLNKAVNEAGNVLVLAMGESVLNSVMNDVKTFKENVSLLGIDVRESESVDLSDLEDLSEDLEHMSDLIHRRTGVYVVEQGTPEKHQFNYDTVIVAQPSLEGKYIYSIYNNDPCLNRGLSTNIFLAK